jgi:hypothetical protein
MPTTVTWAQSARQVPPRAVEFCLGSRGEVVSSTVLGDTNSGLRGLDVGICRRLVSRGRTYMVSLFHAHVVCSRIGATPTLSY